MGRVGGAGGRGAAGGVGVDRGAGGKGRGVALALRTGASGLPTVGIVGTRGVRGREDRGTGERAGSRAGGAAGRSRGAPGGGSGGGATAAAAAAKPKKAKKKKKKGHLYCIVCDKEVYNTPREKVLAMEKIYHRGCFACHAEGCTKTLNLQTYKEWKRDPFCRTCWQRDFGFNDYRG